MGCDTAALAPKPVEIPVPPDESLTTDEYVGLGLPDPDKEWTGEEMAKAQSVLAEVAQKGAEHLPRYESDKSGAVFARLISTDSLKTFVDPALPLGGRVIGVAVYSEAVGKLLQIYFNALKAEQVDGRDMLELSEASYHVMNSMMQVFEQTAGAADPSNPALSAFAAGLDQLRAGAGCRRRVRPVGGQRSGALSPGRPGAVPGRSRGNLARDGSRGRPRLATTGDRRSPSARGRSDAGRVQAELGKASRQGASRGGRGGDGQPARANQSGRNDKAVDSDEAASPEQPADTSAPSGQPSP